MQKLNAGPLTLEYSEGSLWNIRLGDEEAIRRIYLVFQDINWTSRSFQIIEEKWNIAEDHFSADLELRGSHDAENFQAKLQIVGSSAGEIKYGFSGSSTTDFMRNRLGLCLLHPIANLAGKSCKLILSGGTKVISEFPNDISPSQPFKNLSGISHTLNNGQTLEVKFKGEVFETEDHRNWSDASYKTYCTPIELPFPVEVSKGDQIAQEVIVSLSGKASRMQKPTKSKVTIRVSDLEVSLPDIGLNIAEDFSESDHDEFGEIGIGHLRLNLDLDDTSKANFSSVVKLSKKLKPSKRNELEIVDLIRKYLQQKRLKAEFIGRGSAWLDTGTFESLADACEFVRVIEKRQSQKIGCIEEVAFRMGFIDKTQLLVLADKYAKSGYGEYLRNLKK